MRSVKMGLNKDYTFDIFLCVAILILNKSQVSIEQDAASIYGCLNRYVPLLCLINYHYFQQFSSKDEHTHCS